MVRALALGASGRVVPTSLGPEQRRTYLTMFSLTPYLLASRFLCNPRCSLVSRLLLLAGQLNYLRSSCSSFIGSAEPKMLAQFLLLTGTLLSAVLSAPRPNAAEAAAEAGRTTTSTLSATLTFTITSTFVTTVPGLTTKTSTTSSSYSKPTYTATEVYAYKPESPIHLLPFQAKGQIFRLGDTPGVYCPSFVERQGGCSMDTNLTGINGCSLVSSAQCIVTASSD